MMFRRKLHGNRVDSQGNFPLSVAMGLGYAAVNVPQENPCTTSSR